MLITAWYTSRLPECEKRWRCSKSESNFFSSTLDHNSGANLPQAKTKKGTPRYKFSFPKQSKNWVPKKIKSKKDKSYVQKLVDRVVECRAKNIVLSLPTIPDLPRNIATTPRPDKTASIQAHVSRFKVAS